MFSTDIPQWNKDIDRKEQQIDKLMNANLVGVTASSKTRREIENIRNDTNNKISENNTKITQLKIKVALAQGDNLKIKTIEENIDIRLGAYTESLSIIERKRAKMEAVFENKDATI